MSILDKRYNSDISIYVRDQKIQGYTTDKTKNLLKGYCKVHDCSESTGAVRIIERYFDSMPECDRRYLESRATEDHS